MAISSWCSYETWWFSIAMLVYQRVSSEFPIFSAVTSTPCVLRPHVSDAVGPRGAGRCGTLATAGRHNRVIVIRVIWRILERCITWILGTDVHTQICIYARVVLSGSFPCIIWPLEHGCRICFIGHVQPPRRCTGWTCTFSNMNLHIWWGYGGFLK